MVVIDTTTGQLGSEPIGTGAVLTLTGNTGGPVPPTAGNINIVNDNTTVNIAGNPGTNTLTQDFAVSHLLIGSNAAPLPLSVSQNVGLGIGSLSALTNGAQNVAIGYQSLVSATASGQNTAVGYRTLAALNAGTGSVETNTAIGFEALTSMQAGTNNTAVGRRALWQANATNSDNVALGFGAGNDLVTGNNNIYISNYGVANESNTIRIGYTNPPPSSKTAHTANYMGGVLGNTISGSIVNIDGSTAQLGVTAMSSDSSGRVTNASQPAFSVYLGTSDTNATGNGAVYTLGSGNALTKVFDQGTNITTAGVFTAPVTGIYSFQAGIVLTNSTSATEAIIFFQSSVAANSKSTRILRGASTNNFGVSGATLINMTAGDTLTLQVQANGNGADTMTVNGNAVNTWFTGYLVA